MYISINKIKSSYIPKMKKAKSHDTHHQLIFFFFSALDNEELSSLSSISKNSGLQE